MRILEYLKCDEDLPESAEEIFEWLLIYARVEIRGRDAPNQRFNDSKAKITTKEQFRQKFFDNGKHEIKGDQGEILLTKREVKICKQSYIGYLSMIFSTPNTLQDGEPRVAIPSLQIKHS